MVPAFVPGLFYFCPFRKPYFCFMIKKISVSLIAIIALSCGDGSYKKATDAQDAGREFIRASLDGDFKKARFYLLKNDDNVWMLEKMQSDYQSLPAELKRIKRESNIRPVSITPVNDSLTKYTYWQTANPKDTIALSVVKLNGEWLVDLKSIIEQ